MKKFSRSISIYLLLILFLLSACGVPVSETAVEVVNKQEGFTFIPQEVQPIEENPVMLPGGNLAQAWIAHPGRSKT